MLNTADFLYRKTRRDFSEWTYFRIHKFRSE